MKAADPYRYDEAEAVLVDIQKQVRAGKFVEAAKLCDHLRLMLLARRAILLDNPCQ